MNDLFNLDKLSEKIEINNEIQSKILEAINNQTVTLRKEIAEVKIKLHELKKDL